MIQLFYVTLVFTDCLKSSDRDDRLSTKTFLKKEIIRGDVKVSSTIPLDKGYSKNTVIFNKGKKKTAHNLSLLSLSR